jgi:hypothetical protein
MVARDGDVQLPLRHAAQRTRWDEPCPCISAEPC